MKPLKRALRIMGKCLLALTGMIVLYLIAGLLIPKIPVNVTDKVESREVTIYIKTNGVHTDIVVPIKTEFNDWSEKVRFEHIKSRDASMRYIGFGWGDKGFYLNTPEWSDLKFSTAFNAAFYLGTSAMPATFYKGIAENEDCIRIDLSEAEYGQLCRYISDHFQYDAKDDPIFINATTYGDHDSFYEGVGKYSLFYTCNTWANNALKAADQKAALWTPTDTGIFDHYR